MKQQQQKNHTHTHIHTYNNKNTIKNKAKKKNKPATILKDVALKDQGKNNKLKLHKYCICEKFNSKIN